MPLATGNPGALAFAGLVLCVSFPLAWCAAAAAGGIGADGACGFGERTFLRLAAFALALLPYATVARGILLGAAPRKIGHGGALGFALAFLGGGVLPLFATGVSGEWASRDYPAPGWPLHPPAVFACEAEPVPVHLVFGALFLVVALALVREETAGALRAWFAPRPQGGGPER